MGNEIQLFPWTKLPLEIREQSVNWMDCDTKCAFSLTTTQNHVIAFPERQHTELWKRLRAKHQIEYRYSVFIDMPITPHEISMAGILHNIHTLIRLKNVRSGHGQKTFPVISSVYPSYIDKMHLLKEMDFVLSSDSETAKLLTDHAKQRIYLLKCDYFDDKESEEFNQLPNVKCLSLSSARGELLARVLLEHLHLEYVYARCCTLNEGCFKNFRGPNILKALSLINCFYYMKDLAELVRNMPQLKFLNVDVEWDDLPDLFDAINCHQTVKELKLHREKVKRLSANIESLPLSVETLHMNVPHDLEYWFKSLGNLKALRLRCNGYTYYEFLLVLKASLQQNVTLEKFELEVGPNFQGLEDVLEKLAIAIKSHPGFIRMKVPRYDEEDESHPMNDLLLVNKKISITQVIRFGNWPEGEYND